MNLQTVEEIARKTRREFLTGTINKKELEKAYLHYAKIKDVEGFLKNAQKLFPKLNCGLASCYLKEHIKGSTIIQGKYKQYNHTFLSIKNIIVDITADQYGGPEIYVGPLVFPWEI